MELAWPSAEGGGSTLRGDSVVVRFCNCARKVAFSATRREFDRSKKTATVMAAAAIAATAMALMLVLTIGKISSAGQGLRHPPLLCRSSVAPAEAVREWPVNEPAFADQVLSVEIAEHAAIGAVELVVAHGEITVGADLVGGVAISKLVGDSAVIVEHFASDFVVEVAAIRRDSLGHCALPFLQGFGLDHRVSLVVEGIKHFKMTVARGDAAPIGNDVAIVADLDRFARQADKAFDVELVRWQAGNAAGFKNDNFTTLRFAEVVGEPIDQQMITSDDFYSENVLTLLNDSGPNNGPVCMLSFAADAKESVTGERNGINFARETKTLAFDERKERFCF